MTQTKPEEAVTLDQKVHTIVHKACAAMVGALTEEGITYTRHLCVLRAAEPHLEAMAMGWAEDQLREFHEFMAKSEGYCV